MSHTNLILAAAMATTVMAVGCTTQDTVTPRPYETVSQPLPGILKQSLKEHKPYEASKDDARQGELERLRAEEEYSVRRDLKGRTIEQDSPDSIRPKILDEEAEYRPSSTSITQPKKESKAKLRMPAMGEMVQLHSGVSSLPANTAIQHQIRLPSEPVDRENYADFEDNPIKRVSDDPVSTFSIDVDTAAYANMRRMLNAGRMPASDAVRIEEMINYFSYDYSVPENRTTPFSVTIEIAPSPWNSNRHLLMVGLKGYEVQKEQLPPSNLVFLLDVSGSMNSPNKLPLLKNAFNLLVKQLRPQDKVSIVVYAGASGVVLEPTAGNQHAKILGALSALRAGGSTNGSQGIRAAYQMAQQGFIQGGINRVILATDGDFNVGTVSIEALKDLIETKRKSGITLSVFGFGAGNYNDHLMEELSNRGNGNAAYVDSLREAKKALVDQMAGTLLTIARDTKIQIEFNPAMVDEYRLIGYVNRKLRREDFNNDKIDAGDIGAGHTVTALYEIHMGGRPGNMIDPLRYQDSKRSSVREEVGMPSQQEIAFLRLRYKQPESSISQLIERPIHANTVQSEMNSASERLRFASAVAGFGQLLRGANHTGSFGYDDVLKLARSSRGQDANGHRGEFLQLVGLAQALDVRNQNHHAQR